MDHPKAKGDRTTLAVMLALQEAGYMVLMPFGENTRYDLVIDDGQSFSRIQCKTGRLRHGTVLFNTCSCYGHHMNPGRSRRDYHGEIDYFAVHCLQTAGVYLVPITAMPARSYGSLRSTRRTAIPERCSSSSTKSSGRSPRRARTSSAWERLSDEELTKIETEFDRLRDGEDG